MKRVKALLAFGLLCAATHANATARASLDRDHVALGENVTLSIGTDSPTAKPDLSVLRKDFDVRGMVPISRTQEFNNVTQRDTIWAAILVPRHSGVLDIPALAVGSDRTAPLRVGVEPPSSSANVDSPSGSQSADHAGSSNDPVFIESAISPDRPYVGQSTIYTLRVYYAVTPLGWEVEAPTPDNGDLRQMGDDTRDSVMLHGQRYDVFERHFLMQPEHSGTLHIPAPVFEGRMMPDLNNAFDDNPAVGNLRVKGKAIDAQVRERPAQAGDPWLPARSVSLSIDPLASTLRAGEPFSLVVHLQGDGVTASQLPEISLPTIPGAQVYPEPSSTEEHARGGSLQAERVRRFAIVADRAGALHLPDLTMPWWDVVNDHAALARVTLPQAQVLPGSAMQRPGDANAPSKPVAGAPGASAVPVSVLRGWQVATFVLAALFVLALLWGWRRGRFEGADTRGDEGESQTQVSRGTHTLPGALALGDASAIAQALCDAAPGPRTRQLHEVALRLDDPAQRAAVQAWEAARWRSDGQPSMQALAQLRAAFARSPRWRAPRQPSSHADTLPPLYPD